MIKIINTTNTLPIKYNIQTYFKHVLTTNKANKFYLKLDFR